MELQVSSALRKMCALINHRLRENYPLVQKLLAALLPTLALLTTNTVPAATSDMYHPIPKKNLDTTTSTQSDANNAK